MAHSDCCKYVTYAWVGSSHTGGGIITTLQKYAIACFIVQIAITCAANIEKISANNNNNIPSSLLVLNWFPFSLCFRMRIEVWLESDGSTRARSPQQSVTSTCWGWAESDGNPWQTPVTHISQHVTQARAARANGGGPPGWHRGWNCQSLWHSRYEWH